MVMMPSALSNVGCCLREYYASGFGVIAFWGAFKDFAGLLRLFIACKCCIETIFEKMVTMIDFGGATFRL